MVERLAAALGGVDEDAEILASALLADKFVERPWPKRRIGILRRAFGRADAGGVGGQQRECSTSLPRISTQSCLRSSHTEKRGRGKRGSANAPTGIATSPSNLPAIS